MLLIISRKAKTICQDSSKGMQQILQVANGEKKVTKREKLAKPCNNFQVPVKQASILSTAEAVGKTRLSPTKFRIDCVSSILECTLLPSPHKLLTLAFRALSHQMLCLIVEKHLHPMAEEL